MITCLVGLRPPYRCLFCFLGLLPSIVVRVTASIAAEFQTTESSCLCCRGWFFRHPRKLWRAGLHYSKFNTRTPGHGEVERSVWSHTANAWGRQDWGPVLFLAPCPLEMPKESLGSPVATWSHPVANAVEWLTFEPGTPSKNTVCFWSLQSECLILFILSF